MKYLLLLVAVCFWNFAVSQSTQSTDQIRQQMAKIRQTTNWDDPVAAKKANEEIKKLSQQLSGGKSAINVNPTPAPTKALQANIQVKTINKESVVKIADRFFQSSYKQLDAVIKSRYDNEFKNAEKGKFSSESVRKLTSTGAFLLQFGNDLNEACVYMASAVKINPLDTLSVNNFGAYLRMLDSTKTALSVHLYANSLFNQSPVILTQIGCSYFELKDYRKAEDYFKEALKYNPGFGQAHTALCDLYLQNGRWKDALQQLFDAVVGNGMSYGNAHGSFGMIKNAAQNSSSGNSSLTSNITAQNSSGQSGGNDTKGDFWGENNLQIRPEDMLSSLDPDANIPDNEKPAPSVPPDNHLKMPDFPLVSKLEDWTKGGAFGEAVNGVQSYMATLAWFNSEFKIVQQAQPAIPPDAILRDYPNERFAIDCILEYFRYQSKKEYKKYAEKVAPLPKQAGWFIEDYFKKHEKYRQELENCLKASYDNYKGCMLQCERYEAGSAARETCQQNCEDQKKYNDNECNRLYCLHDCNAANDCNNNMNGVFGQFNRQFTEHKNKQQELLDDLYAFTDKWLAKIYSPYWSKIYAYEIIREALGIIGHVYVAYQQAFQGTVTSNCGMNCSEYVIQPPVPIGKVITKEMKGNECPPMGKHKFGLGPCDLGLDCESIEFGCTEGISASIKRNFKKKTTTGFLGVGIKGDAGVLSASVRAGIEITANDNNEVENVGGKMDVSVSTGWGPAKVSATSSVGYSVMTGLNSKSYAGISGKAQ